jgi:hypothetical protein
MGHGTAGHRVPLFPRRDDLAGGGFVGRPAAPVLGGLKASKGATASWASGIGPSTTFCLHQKMAEAVYC